MGAAARAARMAGSAWLQIAAPVSTLARRRRWRRCRCRLNAAGCRLHAVPAAPAGPYTSFLGGPSTMNICRPCSHGPTLHGNERCNQPPCCRQPPAGRRRKRAGAGQRGPAPCAGVLSLRGHCWGSGEQGPHLHGGRLLHRHLRPAVLHKPLHARGQGGGAGQAGRVSVQGGAAVRGLQRGWGDERAAPGRAHHAVAEVTAATPVRFRHTGARHALWGRPKQPRRQAQAAARDRSSCGGGPGQPPPRAWNISRPICWNSISRPRNCSVSFTRCPLPRNFWAALTLTCGAGGRRRGKRRGEARSCGAEGRRKKG